MLQVPRHWPLRLCQAQPCCCTLRGRAGCADAQLQEEQEAQQAVCGPLLEQLANEQVAHACGSTIGSG